MQDTVEYSSLSSLRRAPADLVAVGLCTLVVALTALLPIGETPLWAVIRAAFVGFVPGYALVAALSPRAPTAAHADATRLPERVLDGRIDRLERFALSIAASCGLLAVVAGVSFAAPAVNGTATAVGALAVLTVSFAAVAAVRRMARPPSERFGRPVGAWLALLDPSRSAGSGRDLLSTVALVFVVLFVLSSAAYAMAPAQEPGYTELYLLSEGDGEPVAEGYPDELTVGEEQSLIVGVRNEEGSTTTYTAVVQLQEVEFEGSETSVRSSSELDRFSLTLDDGETVEDSHTVTPDRPGEDLRLIYLLYVGEPPDSPTAENAYRSTYVWVDVGELSG